VDTTCHSNDQAPVDNDRILRGPAQPARRRPATARAVVDGYPSLHPVDGAGRPEARVGLVRQSDGFVLVEVVGAVDIAVRQELTDVLGGAADSGSPAVIVDLTAVTLLAAAGLNCLQQTANLLAGRGRRLHLVCAADDPAARALRLLDPGGGRPLHVDVASAVATATERA
jgi:anti-anti-sigma factor